jgi:alcohol dehydrogenase class IV
MSLKILKVKDREARYFLAYAALMGGVCFDNGLLHYTHALEHPLSAIKPELSHGLGLAMLLPAVVKEIYTEKADTLAYILEPITGEIESDKDVEVKVYEWLKSVGVSNKLIDEGFSESDVEKLVNLAQTTPSLDGLLSLAPNEANVERIANIYKNSL